ncbi:MAG: YegS/Rv2252/BmrU family lipid kinase [Oscillospiraceae bacterium]|nr:YegS/Rv2252/BmrU family lipid kinase [Oscillospiraceae bacterium]
MEHLFIINPAAGKVDKTTEYSALIRTLCERKGLTYRIAHSQAPGDITRIAREAAQTGKELRIYACGGDGTLNEAVNGVAGYPNAAVTCYVAGSGNDFVKIFSQPDAFRSLERLLDAEEAEFDLIDCNGSYALNICCVGLDARVGNKMAEFKRLPGVSGSGAYILSTGVNLMKGISEHYVIEVNGERIDDRQTMICIANARWYGGGFHAVPDADPADGLLDVLIVKKLNLFQVAGVIGKYKEGRYKEVPHLVRHIRTDAIRVICDGETPLNLDGEIVPAKVADCRISPHKLRFFYPKGLTY